MILLVHHAGTYLGISLYENVTYLLLYMHTLTVRSPDLTVLHFSCLLLHPASRSPTAPQHETPIEGWTD